MSALIIVGNGFDLAHGMPTSYESFRRYIIDKYPDSQEFRDMQIDIDDYADLLDDEFAAETLLYAMDHASGIDWNNFEDALGHINFYHKLPRHIETDDMTLEVDNRSAKEYLLLIDRISSAIIASSKWWQDFLDVG
jgi:hypothetical protein